MIRLVAPVSISKPFLLTHKRLVSLSENPLAEEGSILTKAHKSTRTMILNRPKHLNAFSLPMFEAMCASLKEWEKSEDVHMMLLKGRGRALGSGADIKNILQILDEPSRNIELDLYLDLAYEIAHFIKTMDTPMITFMNGITVGSVCSFGVFSRFNVATENTKILLPETRFGHFCDVGANFFLTRLSRNIGKYIALTAQMVHAEDALLSGLATHFVPSNKLEYLEDSLINLERPNDDTIRKTIENFAINPDDAPISNIMQGRNRDIIDSCFQFDTVAEILGALEKEGSEFSLNTINEICRGSPISVALTLEQLRRGSKMSLIECLQMERNSWRISPYQPDFYEGIVSTIIERRKPQWSCNSHLDVDFEKDVLATYFGNKIN